MLASWAKRTKLNFKKVNPVGRLSNGVNKEGLI